MATYLFMAAGAVICFLLLATLMILKRFREKVKAKIVDILKKTFFNNLIRSFNLSYFKLTISFSIVVYLNMKSDDPLPFPRLIAPLVFLGLTPFAALYVLLRNRETLPTPDARGKIERMYQDIHLTRNSWTIYYYPFFLLRRFLFVIIPIMMFNYPIIQL